MGPAAGVRHLQGEHQPPPGAGECLEGAQLVRHEGRPRPGNPRGRFSQFYNCIYDTEEVID